MSAITNVWRQLVQRRLWPVAILLIAALAAVPLALAKDPDPAVPAAAVPAADAAASAESALAVQPIVAPATAADRGKRRKVLGARKNVFGLPPEPDAGSAAAPNSIGSVTAQDPVTPTADSGTQPSDRRRHEPVDRRRNNPPATDPTPAPAPRTYAMHELTVRFGDSARAPRASRSSACSRCRRPRTPCSSTWACSRMARPLSSSSTTASPPSATAIAGRAPTSARRCA